MTFSGVSKLVEAFKHKQVSAEARQVHTRETLKADVRTSRWPSVLGGPFIHTCALPSSSSTLDMFCSFLEKPGGFYEFFQTSVTSLPAAPSRSPYAVRNSEHFLEFLAHVFLSHILLYCLYHFNTLCVPLQEIYTGT